MSGLLDLIEKFLPLKDAMYNDSATIILNIVGSALIGVTFCAIGLVCLLQAKHVPSQPAHKQRRILAQLIGTFLFTCGLARFMDIYCIWYNVAILNGWIKVLTGVISLITLGYVPTVMKAMRSTADLKEVQETLKEVDKKVDEVRKTIDERFSNKEE